MKTQLHCTACNKMFEISNAIAEAMTRWRETSGEPITCEKCAGTLDEIDTNTKTVARNVMERGSTERHSEVTDPSNRTAR